MARLLLIVYLGAQPVTAACAAEWSRSANPTSALLQWLLGLILVLAAIGLSAWLARKLGRFSSPVGGQMKILGGLSLGGREKVIILQVGAKQLILGITPGSVRTLDVLEGDDLLKQVKEPVTDSHQLPFAARLKEVISEKTHGWKK